MAAVLSVLVLALLVFLLRTRRIREKFAAVWIALAVVITIVGAIPNIAIWLARLLGVQTPVNLIFAVGFAVIVAVCLQLSSEVSNLEDEARTLAEELALLALEVREVREATSRDTATRRPTPTDATTARADDDGATS